MSFLSTGSLFPNVSQVFLSSLTLPFPSSLTFLICSSWLRTFCLTLVFTLVQTFPYLPQGHFAAFLRHFWVFFLAWVLISRARRYIALCDHTSQSQDPGATAGSHQSYLPQQNTLSDLCFTPSLCLVGDALCRNPASTGRRRTARGHSAVLDIACVSLSGQSPCLLGIAACPQGFQQHTARVCHGRGRAGRWGTMQGASGRCPPPGTEAALRQLCSPQRSASASMI